MVPNDTSSGLRIPGRLSGGSPVEFLLATIIAFVGQFVSTIVTSRILLPEAVGIFALAMVVVRLVGMFSQFGLAAAVVQAPELSLGAFRDAWFRNTVRATLSAAVLVALSWPIAVLVLHQDAVAPALAVLAATIVAVALAEPPFALLRRHKQFRACASADLVSLGVVLPLLSVVFALLGFGTFSLVASAVLANTLRVVLAVVLVRCLPRPERRGGKHLQTFGNKVTVLGVLEYVSYNLDVLTVGRFVGAAGAGAYSRANNLANLPGQLIGVGVSRAAGPYASRADAATLDGIWRRLSVSVAFVALAIGSVLSTLAPQVVRVVYGDQWELSIGVLHISALAAAVNFLSLTPAIILEARGILRPKLVVQVMQLTVLLLGLTLAVVLGTGLTGIATAWLTSELTRFVAYIVVIHRRTDLPVRPVLGHYCAILACVVLPSAATLLIRQQLPPLDPVPLLLTLGACWLSIFLVVVHTLDPRRTYKRHVAEMFDQVIGKGLTGRSVRGALRL